MRLADVPLERRLAAAELLVRSQKLTGYDALDLKLAAASPVENTGLWVGGEEAERVLGT